MNEIVKLLPEMKTGDSLVAALSVLPDYDEKIRCESEAVRLVALSDLYRLYIPSPMTTEVYSKLYLALLRSMQKKLTRTAVLQRNENHKAIQQQAYTGIMGGSDSFTIIGNSGIGKSSAISRSISLLQSDGIIETQKPYTKIIPCVVVQCPFDSSVKGLLLEILRKVDETIGSSYYQNALKIRSTTDMLIGNVSQIAINHIGLLVVDEIQNVVNSKHGKSLVGMLTQLINNSGISICMVGTPECSAFFEQAMQLARRSLGLQYQALECDRYFYEFCRTLFSYQYTRQRADISDSVTEWLYEHSGGILAVVVSLIHDAQEIAILSGKEILSMETLNEAYTKRLSMLHGYIAPTIQRRKQTAPKKEAKAEPQAEYTDIPDDFSMVKLAATAKKDNSDIVELLKAHIPVEGVRV